MATIYRNLMKLFLLLFLLIPTLLSAQSSVWKVSKGDAHIFLGGTVHILSKADYPLPDEFTTAYQQSQKLIFETDVARANSPEFQQQMLMSFMFRNGDNLKASLKPETFIALQEYATSIQLPLNNLLPFKPQFVSLMLTMTELQRLGIDSTGVDLFFEQLASKDKKAIGYLETLDEQLNFIMNMGKGREDELILHTIEENRQLGDLMGQLITIWRSGDLAGMNKLAVAPMKQDFPTIYQDLLVTRNNNWLLQIEQLFLDSDVEFMLVGAMHLAGDDGLLSQLGQRGYQVEQLK